MHDCVISPQEISGKPQKSVLGDVIEQKCGSVTIPPAMALTFAQIFGEWVKREREKRKWSQEELAQRAGFSDQGRVSEAESAKKNLTSEKLEKILKALEMDAVSMIVALPELAHELYKADQGKEGMSIEGATLSSRAVAKAKELSAKAQERGAAARRRKTEPKE